jgi:hypothetical protein
MRLMTPAELLIIYLAAGAPFGVYAFLNQNDRPGFLRVALPLLKFAVWPVFATQLIARGLTGKFQNNVADTQVATHLAEETEALRRDIISSLLFENDRRRRELLEDLERFSGIAAAIYEAERCRAPSVPIVLEAGGHAQPDLGAKCVFRRNRARLLEHQNRAFDDFVSELGKASPNGGPFTIEELTERARQLARTGET